MIHYKCDACQVDLSAENNQSGKPAECYKCKNIQTVPLPDFLPRVSCPNCDEEIGDRTEEDSGRIIKCPKCGCAVRLPEMPGKESGCSFTAAILFLAGITLTILTYGLSR